MRSNEQSELNAKLLEDRQLKYRVVTLGCRTNQYESQLFSDQLQKMGHVAAQGEEKADLCIVNTCTVTEHADSSSRHQIRSLAKENPHARIVVTGCMAESASSETLLSLGSQVEIASNREKEQLIGTLFPGEELPELSIQTFEGHTRAFVKIQDGCNSFCTYCIIPYVRGRSRSRPLQEILDEVRTLVENGYQEVVLTGINIGDFEGPDGLRLAGLVRAVDRIDGIRRIRISSIDPDEVDDDLADAVLGSRHTCPSMHLVLQSGSNVVLKRMNRKYTRQIFLDTAARMTRLNPDFTVTTDIIVGFPGETEVDFAETLDVVSQVQFAKVHIFPYSPRKKTRAALYPDQVPQAVIGERKAKLSQLSERMAFELRESYKKRTMPVLLEEGEGEFQSGHTPNFLRVRIPKGPHVKNDIVEVELEENEPDALLGKVVI
jgi:threonylcarbamoyladenosine tRNA methylthiotransferase MtaB